jgi:hypothetical protein
MANEAFFKSKTFRFSFPIIMIGSIINIVTGGIAFGRWLFHYLN